MKPVQKRIVIPTSRATYTHVRDILRRAKQMTGEHDDKISIKYFEHPDSFLVVLAGVPQIVAKLATYLEGLSRQDSWPKQEQPKFAKSIRPAASEPR